MHSLLKHKMLQFTLKMSLYMAPPTTHSHAAQHPVHTLQTEAHIATAHQQF
jgi:hypothetical protein